MNNFKIGTRLALGFSLIIVLLLTMSGIGFWRITDGNAANALLQDRQAVNAMILQWARQAEVNTSLALASTNMTAPEAQAKAREELEISDQRIADLRKSIAEDLQQPGAVSLFNKAASRQDTYFQGRQQAFKHLEDWEINQANEFFNNDMPVISSQVIASIDELSAFQQQYIQEMYDQTDEANQLGIIILGVATLLALIISPLFAWRITSSITRPLQEAVQVANSIAQRKLDQRIQARGSDEISLLMRSLQGMSESLRSAIREVGTGANSIASAAAQITTGNLDLSARTEQQSSSLAETAATMEEITATVRQNADNTQQANTLAEAAAKTASDGGTIVSGLVGTMGEINTHSQQVSDIIGVIDSIAFQTNILALNAAVEAARAGEQGRGFAVVASEVRALAQRSASAAREIKELIDTSVEAANKGNEQAAHAGATMQDIVDGIHRVTDIMGEINAANREQTTGIEEINAAVTQMDDVTRQNASLVEEAAAAAGSLQEQADNLARLVATFQLGNEQQAHTGRSSDGQRTSGQARARADQQAHADSHPGKQGADKGGAKQQKSPIAHAPEKVVSPPPRQPRPEPAHHSAAGNPGTQQRPALQSPGKTTPSSDTDEWTEF